MVMQHITERVEALQLACERVTWLEHLFFTISSDPNASVSTQSLAELGQFVANGLATFTEDARADLLKMIKEGGAA